MFIYRFSVWALFLTACVLGLPAQAEPNTQRIGFTRIEPTSYRDWPSAFLSGNGKIGIMVLGNPLEETVIFNDRGFNLSTGTVRSFDQVSAADLEAIRSDCAAGNFAAADKLAATAPHYKGGGDGSRHPGYAMFISIPPAGDIRGYLRSCDFRTGEITVKWTDDRGDWIRKAFVSRRDNVDVQLLTAPGKGTLTCSLHLATDPGMGLPKEMNFTTTASLALLNIRAKYKPKIDAGYEGVTRVIVTGGSTTVTGDILHVTNAQSILLLTRTAKYFDHCEDNWNKEAIQKDLALLPADYDALLQAHVAVHQPIYDRVKVDFGASSEERAKTNEDLLAEQKASDLPVPALWERIFDAGRYYYLSASSDQTPPDLLGMWNGDCRAGWGGYYHTDANLNLQIGGGNIGDMPEAMEGYFKLNEAWRPDLKINATKLLGCRGLLAPGNSPGPQSGLMASLNEYYPYQYATGEEGWLLYPFWEHYLITGDTAFLKDRLYPLLKEMGEFYEDFLVKQDSNGKYIFAGSVSPENQPGNLRVSLVNNSVFDVSGAKFCLSALIQACNLLGLDQGPGQGVEKWSAALKKLPPYLVNDDGALQEWAWPGLADNYGHRHSSHLVVAWPYREITPESDPVLYKAAVTALAKKDEHKIMTGHGILHDAFIAAVLKNNQSLEDKILRLTKEDFYFYSLFSSHNGKHEIFCSDTCNAVPGIMMEMLVSSEPGRLEFLPALPDGLPKGSISGVKARCRVTVQNLAWDQVARTITAIVRSDIDQSVTLIERDGIDGIHTGAAVSDSSIGPIARLIQLKAGVSTPITLNIGRLRYRPPNVALHQPVNASSDDGKNLPAAATDGDVGTRWASTNADNQWLSVDLGSSQPIDKVRLDWETSTAKDFDIEVSEDGKTWVTVKSVTSNDKTGWQDYTDLKAKGRYVRIDCKTRVTKYGFSLWEIQIFSL
jgi:alpha-L-fucosidase 2